MKYKIFLYCVVISFFSLYRQVDALHDINLIGYLNNYDSLARHTSSFLNTLPQSLKINIFKTKGCSGKGLPERHQKIIASGINLFNTQELKLLLGRGLHISGISIYTDSWWHSNEWNKYKSIPNNSIKFAYCVVESTKVPKDIVEKFNKNFDAVIVVDEWFVNVCKNSGVTIPVFALPLALDSDLNSLLSRPLKKKSNSPFTFGCSGLFSPRKNQTLLMRAFDQEFRDNQDVQLIIHGKSERYFKKIEQLARHLRHPGIKLFRKNLPRTEYENFIANLSCYALISKGEGFSITPREALAAGVPSILSNNTGHKVICDANVVYPVASNIQEPTVIFVGNKLSKMDGMQFNCHIRDVRKALRDVYNNYENYLKRAQSGRDWAKKYLAENLKYKYLNLVNPKKVILGPQNKVTDDFFMTNSKTLFSKYQELCGKNAQYEILIK